MNFLKKHRNFFLRVIDVIIIAMCYMISDILIENKILLLQQINVKEFVTTIIISIVVYGLILEIFGTYKNITRYENGNDYLVYILACVVSCLIMIVLNAITPMQIFTYRINLIATLFIIVSIISYRVTLRFVLTRLTNKINKIEEKVTTSKKNVLVIGAGDATRILIETIKRSLKDSYNIVGLIDDNINKLNYAISGNKILGTRHEIPKICKENNVDLILFAISNISSEDRKNILNICQETGCKLRILPGTKDLIDEKNIMENFRDVEIEDLLGRDPIKLDNQNIKELIKDKVVLVTGGGGSIGSELCRQIITFEPEQLVIVDIYENNLYDIEQELRFCYPDANIKAIVASVRDKKRLNEIFETYKPYLVFHAAAHKHVPLMETSPLEAIKNNVFGTYNVANCADEYKVKRFILISTDKAVNPTNIMGATKRLCEMIIQAKNKDSETEYAAVRFGNVLGSNGSVVPLFKKQIKKGGPITVTHKEITRFFMTIPEAVSLVLQAMTYAEGGEIFVLDMGEPVKIYDMAVKLIKLSGLEPDVDIQIKVTGLRPGEKLYEELLMAEEGLTETKHNKIHIAKPMNINMEMLESKLNKLQNLLDNNVNEDREIIKEVIKDIVPTYKEAKNNQGQDKEPKIEQNNASSDTNKTIESEELISKENHANDEKNKDLEKKHKNEEHKDETTVVTATA